MIGYKWVKYSGGRYYGQGMISVGKDRDGMHLVVGRASHNGDLLPAKAKPEHALAYVSYAGREYIKRDFEILVPLEFEWVEARHGRIPENAVKAGITAGGEILYVGRAYYNGTPCMGKVHRSHREVTFHNYEVLVQS